MNGKNKNLHKKITMKDIANYLNIDRTTVSKAMSDKPGVSQEMVRKVRKAAEELGYRKDIFASGLTTGKNALLALIMRDMDRGIYAPLVAQFQQTARSFNYGIILQFVGSSRNEVVHTIELLKQQRVSGATFVADATNESHNDLLVELVHTGIAVNTTRRDFIHEQIDQIRFDNRKAGYDAAQHLIRLGHRRILFVIGKHPAGTPKERMEGYLQAMADAGLEPEVAEADHTLRANPGEQVQESYRLGRKLWSGGTRPSAMIGMNDSVALGLLHAMKDEQVPVPDSVSIVGFDDLQAVLSVPQITSSRIPMAEAGALAVNLLMSRIKEPFRPRIREMLDCELVIRQSTAAKR